MTLVETVELLNCTILVRYVLPSKKRTIRERETGNTLAHKHNISRGAALPSVRTIVFTGVFIYGIFFATRGNRKVTRARPRLDVQRNVRASIILPIHVKKCLVSRERQVQNAPDLHWQVGQVYVSRYKETSVSFQKTKTNGDTNEVEARSATKRAHFHCATPLQTLRVFLQY